MSTATAPRPDPIDPAASTSRVSVPWMLLAAATSTAVVIGGGAFAAVAAVGAGGDRPDSAIPGNTAFYAEVDIDPSVGQKIAALQFFDGMDTKELEELREGRGREALFDLVADQSDSPFADLDYEADIEPWLGDRLGVGAVPGVDDELIPVLVLQVTDETAAQDALAAIRAEEDATEEFDFFFRGDYAVFTEPQDTQSIEAALDAGTLADNATFNADMESLGQQGVASMWADLPAFQSLSDQARQEVANRLDDADAAALTDADVDLQGRLAATVRFDQEAIEVSGRAIDTGAEAVAKGDGASLISTLPDDTAIAVGVEHGDQYVNQAWALLEEAMGDDIAKVQQEAAAQGFTLPDDITTVLGDSAVLSAGPGLGNVASMFTTGIPVGYSARTDADAAATVVDKAMEAADQEFDLSSGSTDGVFTIAGSQAYQDELVAGGNLGSTRDFTLAVPGAEGADMAAFVDLNALEATYLPMVDDAQARTMLESLATVGMSATSDGEGGGSFSLRLAFDE